MLPEKFRSGDTRQPLCPPYTEPDYLLDLFVITSATILIAAVFNSHRCSLLTLPELTLKNCWRLTVAQGLVKIFVTNAAF